MNNKRIANVSLFIYIIIATANTSIIINRVALLTMTCLCTYSLLLRRKVTVDLQTFCLVLYGIVLFIASFFATAGSTEARQLVLVSYATMFITVFFLKENCESEKDINFFLFAFVCGGIFQLLIMLKVYGTGIITALLSNSNLGTRLGDEESNSNVVGMSFMLGGIIALYFTLVSKNKFKKVILLSCMMILFVFGLLSGSRKAFLMLFMGSGMLLYANSQNKKNFLKKIGSVGGILLVLVFSYDLIRQMEVFSIVTERVDALIEGGEDYSSQERFYMIATGFESFLQNPVLGKGTAASSNYFGTYSHNNYCELLMNTGLLGLVVFYVPIIRNGKILLFLKNKNLLGVLITFLLYWILIGAWGMVIYYEKLTMCLVMLINRWIAITVKSRERKELQCF